MDNLLWETERMETDNAQIERIFSQAADLDDAAERSAFLDTACGQDQQLRAAVERLLKHDVADSFLESPIVAPPTLEQPSEQVGSYIGPYKLIEEIGEGGMGKVFMALQKMPVRRKVALKVIKPGMDSKQVVSRFEAERQALALMDHPCIARVFDGGTTESGRPYFVMELVRGAPITDYCDGRKLTTNERLELFGAVSQAVQHAHQKGIIHRDLKPSNIMITLYDGKPMPKVIDFGIAKATSGQLSEATLVTNYAQMIGTPVYMSPEQAELSSQDIDTRSDVYSLGVLLYELLTGTTPLERERVGEISFDELRRIIREEEPPTPSTRLSTLNAALDTTAEDRRTDRRTLSKQISGELDWIVMKALEKDRTRRYESASELAKDVQRFLNDEAVEACPPSVSYRLKKAVRKHRTGIATAFSVALALVIGLAVATWQAIVATDAKDRATEQQRLAEQRFEEIQQQHQQIAANLDLALNALDEVYIKAIGEDRLLGEQIARPDDMKAPAPLLRPALTDLERELLKRGLTFYDQFAEQNATAPRAIAQTAEAYYRVGLLQAGLGEAEDAATSYRSAIGRFERLIEQNSENSELFRGLAQAYKGLANLTPEWARAKAIFEKSRLAYSRAIELRPDDVSLYLARADLNVKMGGMDSADYEKVLQLDPDNVTAHLGISLRHRYSATALEHAERAVALAPDDPKCHLNLARVLGGGKLVLGDTNGTSSSLIPSDPKGALEHYGRAIELAPELPDVYAARGEFYYNTREYQKALSDLDRALAIKPVDCPMLSTRAQVYGDLGLLDEALADLAKLLDAEPHNHVAHFRCGMIHMKAENWQAAEESISRAIEISPRYHRYKRRAVTYLYQGKTALALDDLKTALELKPKDTSTLRWFSASQLADAPEEFREGLLEIAQTAVKRSPDPAQAYADRAQLYSRLEDYEKADADFAASVELNPRDAGGWRTWGLSQLERGFLKEARESLSKAVEADPGYWLNWDACARVNFALGESGAAADDCSKVLELDPANHTNRLLRCVSYLQLGELNLARKDLASLRLSDMTSQSTRYQRALLCLALGNKTEYRECCRAMLEVSQEESSPDIGASWTAWTCALAANAVDEYAPVVQLAEQAATSDPKSDFNLKTFGGILFRAGQYEKAVEQLTAASDLIEDPDTESKSSAAYTWYLLAMATQRLGKHEEAKQWLQKANEWTDKVLDEHEEGTAPVPWNRKLTLKLFREEAEGLIKDGKSETKEATSEPGQDEPQE